MGAGWSSMTRSCQKQPPACHRTGTARPLRSATETIARNKAPLLTPAFVRKWPPNAGLARLARRLKNRSNAGGGTRETSSLVGVLTDIGGNIMNISRTSLGFLALAAGALACNVHDNTINIPNAMLNVTTDVDVDNVEAGQSVPMTVSVQNVFLVEPAATPPPEHVNDAGHLEFHLDDESTPAILVTAQTSVMVKIPAETKAGHHKVICRVHKHDGTPTDTKFELDINVKVSVTVGGGSGGASGGGTGGSSGGTGGSTGTDARKAPDAY